MNEQKWRLSLPLDDLEAVVLKGLLEGVVEACEKNADMPKDPENSPYPLYKDVLARLEDLCEREVYPNAK